MARITVEDCLKNVKNRFELVIIASKRARQLMRGKDPKLAWENDKATVMALREIAAGHTTFEDSKEEEITSASEVDVVVLVEKEEEIHIADKTGSPQE